MKKFNKLEVLKIIVASLVFLSFGLGTEFIARDFGFPDRAGTLIFFLLFFIMLLPFFSHIKEVGAARTETMLDIYEDHLMGHAGPSIIPGDINKGRCSYCEVDKVYAKSALKELGT